MADRSRIPTKLSDFDQYVRNTATYINANSNGFRLGLIDVEVTGWADKGTAWALLYPKYTDLAQRTTNITLQVKNFKKSFIEFATPLLNRMATSVQLNTTDRTTLNLPERDTVPTARGKINDIPFFKLTSVSGGRIEVRSRVSEDASRSSMPELADGIEIKYLIGAVAPANVTAATSSVVSKKALFFIDTDGTKATQRMFAFARYINLSNPANNGSFSGMVSVVIQG